MRKNKLNRARMREDAQMLALPLAIALIYLLLANRLFGASCLSVILLHRPCPGCGLSRAAYALLKLDFAAAWRYNPAVYLWALLAAALIRTRYFGKGGQRICEGLLILTGMATIGVYLWRLRTGTLAGDLELAALNMVLL